MKKIIFKVGVLWSIMVSLTMFNSKPKLLANANESIFGPNVYIIDDSMDPNEVQEFITATHQNMTGEGAKGEFSSNRYAILFKPGKYELDIELGFYTTLAGLGINPDDVTIQGEFNVHAKWANGNGTRNFWRSVENFSVISNNNPRWAVSQAAPMRRMHFNKPLELYDLTNTNQMGWVSGGYIADSLFDEHIAPGTQQQFFSRNNQYTDWKGSNWNTVLVGDANPPQNTRPFPQQTYTIIDETPIIREKPYLYIDDQGEYFVFVPDLVENSSGITWKDGNTKGTSVSIDEFFIANPSHRASDINVALASGKHIFFTPGMYELEEAIQVNNPNTIVFGIGYPTLTPKNGHAAIKIADKEGIKVSGLLIDAGEENSDVLLEVGEKGSQVRHSDNPITLHDIFFRIGGYKIGKAEVTVVIHSNDVLADHFWVWRADHGNGVGWTRNTAKNGLIVNGDHVTIYGLFVEHYQEYQTIWNGESGRVYFYQNELPYDVPNQQSWMSYNGTKNGFAAYKVADDVNTHELWGAGSYAYFRDAVVKLNSSFEVPNKKGMNINHLTTVWLNGKPGSEITHVINNYGTSVTDTGAGMVRTVATFNGNDLTPPSIPQNLKATVHASQVVELSWDASTDDVGVAGYDIYRNDEYIASSLTPHFIDQTLRAETSYTYKVKAKDGGDNHSDFSQPIQVTTYKRETNLNRTHWTVTPSSSSSEDKPRFMFDGGMTTRWSSGVPMTPGMSIIIDMMTEESFDGIVMDSGPSINDYARGYKVYVSDDGITWGSPIKVSVNTLPIVYVHFEQQSARYIKIEQTGTSSSWWSIAELNVFKHEVDQPDDTPTKDKKPKGSYMPYLLTAITVTTLAGGALFFYKKQQN